MRSGDAQISLKSFVVQSGCTATTRMKQPLGRYEVI